MSRFIAFVAVVVAIGSSGAWAQTAKTSQTPTPKPADKATATTATSADSKPVASQPAKQATEAASSEKASSKKLQGTILLPSSGEYIWWATTASGHRADPSHLLKSDKISFTVEAAEPSPLLYIYNTKTGMEAVVEASAAVKDTEFKLVDADFDHIRRLAVSVSAKNGNPVKTASIVLKDSEGTVTRRVIDATDGGDAAFFDVAKGDASLTVGVNDVSITQEIKVGEHIKGSVDSAEVVLPGDVPTLEPVKKTPSSTPEKPAKPARSASGSIFTALVSILLLIAVVYMAYATLKARNITLQSALEKAGVPIGDEEPAGVTAQPQTPAAEPLDPNLVGPAPGALPSASPAPSTPGVTGPRLVAVAGSYSGSIFPVSAASTVIGRDPTCDIPLPADATASRRHARFTNEGGVVRVQDEGSSNGTIVNGQKVDERQLSPGDEVQIGSTRFRYEA